MKKKDSFYAKLAFYLSLGFWIPLFNVALSITAIILAMIALKRRIKEPDKYGGLGFAITALILCLTSIIMTVVGLILYLLSPQICGSVMCELHSQGITINP